MATNAISSFFSSPQFSISGVTSGGQVATGLMVKSVSIKLTSKLMQHTREDGSTVVDSRVIQPTLVNVEGFCDSINKLEDVNNVMLNRDTFFSLSSKGLVFNNMMAEGESISQIPEMISATPVRLSFKQVLTKNVKPITFAQQSDSSVIARGMNLLKSAETTIQSLFNSVNG